MKRYVGTWADSTSPLLMATEGDFDERGVFWETSEGPDPDGTLIRVRMTTEVVDANQMFFRIFVIGEGGREWKMLEVDHMRRRFIE